MMAVVPLVAVNCAAVRWGLRLPNWLANGQIQLIVIGSASTMSLLAIGLAMAVRDWLSRRSVRPFWLGFLACGAVGVTAYIVHARFFCPPFHHYSVNYEVWLGAVLRRCGMTWNPRNPASNPARYAIIITALVILLSLPQVAFAVLGGWLAERSRWGRSVLEPE
jgi:hypothetical protein